MEQAGPVKFAQNTHHPTGAMDIFNVVLRAVGRHFAKLRYLAGQAINICHGEIHLALLGSSQQVEDGIG